MQLKRFLALLCSLALMLCLLPSTASVSYTHLNLPPAHPAKAPYSLYKQASDTVRSGVIIGLGSRMQVFQSELIKKITTRCV